MTPPREPLVRMAAPDFDLAATLHCGQVFHWQLAGRGHVGAIGSTPVYLEQRADCIWVSPGSTQLVRRYLALDHPMAEVYGSFPKDPAMAAALAACHGLRIIRQPLWECLASFITSALKQVAHIAQISHRLRREFGEPLGDIAGVRVFAYPSPERIAGLTEAALRECGLGFRARSLLETAHALAIEPGKLEALRKLDRAQALDALRQFRGVGTKVANCVLLFGYEHLDAFPIDVWIERVLREQYFSARRKITTPRLQAFADDYFGPYRGYAQQYLFHAARLNGRPRQTAKKRFRSNAPKR